MSDLLARYVGLPVLRIAAGGGGMGGTRTIKGRLQAPEGQWLIIEDDEGQRCYLAKSVVYFLEVEPPSNPLETLPRSLGGNP